VPECPASLLALARREVWCEQATVQFSVLGAVSGTIVFTGVFASFVPSTVHKSVFIRSVSELSAHVLEHLACWPIGCIRNDGFHGVDNLAHDRPILGAQVARQVLLSPDGICFGNFKRDRLPPRSFEARKAAEHSSLFQNTPHGIRNCRSLPPVHQHRQAPTAIDPHRVKYDAIWTCRHSKHQKAPGLQTFFHLSHRFEVALRIKRIAIHAQTVVFERRDRKPKSKRGRVSSHSLIVMNFMRLVRRRIGL
jgi:hypothetical protein